jgi:hypothetical protein
MEEMPEKRSGNRENNEQKSETNDWQRVCGTCRGLAH